MSNFSSIGDLSRSFQLRLANYNIKSRIDTLVGEVTTGVKSDIAKANGGDLSQVNQIEGRIEALKTFMMNIHQSTTELTNMQSTLTAIHDIVAFDGPSILAGSGTGSHNSLLIHASQAADDLEVVVNMLNGSVGGRFLFSGQQTDAAPLVSADQMLSQIQAAISGATTVGDIVTAVDQWFDAVAGAGGFLDHTYTGSDNGRAPIPIDRSTSIGTDLTAAAPEIRETLKGLILGALAWDRRDSIPTTELRDLMEISGTRLTTAASLLTDLRAHIGMQEQATARAKIRNESESAALQTARSNLIGADPYETATALKEAVADLQNIYVITERISSLKLTDYLR